MKKAFVIMCNDYPQAVCMGDEAEAKVATDKLRDRDYQTRYRWTMTAEEHRTRCYWRPDEVPVVP